jgi:(2Fe-2S) ferredoxin
MTLLERHIFVCVNEREAASEKGCCFSKGGKAVRDELKKQLAVRGLLSRVRANKSGCLDQCEHGVAMVVYPEQVWYGGVTVEDVSEIVDRHIVQGQYVERLLISGQEHSEDGAQASVRLPIVDERDS